MSVIIASEFDGDILQMSNKDAAEILRKSQHNMNLYSGRANGRTSTIMKTNIALCKAIDLLNNTQD